MYKTLTPLITAVVLLLSLTCSAQELSDGPYIRIKNDSASITWIENNSVHHQQLDTVAAKRWLHRKYPRLFSTNTSFTLKHAPEVVDLPKNTPLAFLSDPHGQLEVFTTLLQNHQIIDEQWNWSFGKGHLMLVGDVFDRGPGATEILWLLYKWQQQATEAGGALYMVPGNHELMVLQNDLRYLHNKYLQVDSLLGTTQTALYDSTMLMGQWLRQRPTIMKINSTLVVHGGISPKLIASGNDLHAINRSVRQTMDLSRDSIRSTPSLSLLYRGNGPFWYRGFFKEALTPDQVDSLLEHFQAERIVVGHTSFSSLHPVFGHKVIGVDASMKRGKSGEILLYKSGKWLRGTFAGEEFPLKAQE